MTREEKAERNALMREYKAEGHTMQEVADKFGLTKHRTQQICKGIAPQKGAAKGRPNPHKGILKDEHKVKEFVESRVKGVEYFGNYTGADGRVDLRCKECGAVFNRSMISVRKGHCSCPTCREKRDKIRREKAAAERLEKQKQRDAQKRQKEIENAKRAEQIELVFHACPVCGTMTTRRKYCSDHCMHKANWSTKEARRREKIKAPTADKDITVMGLFKRDAGVCHICGGQCDTKDYMRRGKIFIAGDRYPSIDHVVPLAKGGSHSWDNVKLAHRRCNTLKRDNFAV